MLQTNKLNCCGKLTSSRRGTQEGTQSKPSGEGMLQKQWEQKEINMEKHGENKEGNQGVGIYQCAGNTREVGYHLYILVKSMYLFAIQIFTFHRRWPET